MPLIVQWPGGISADAHGQVRPQFCHAIDIMPTILDAAGVEMPDVVDGVSQQPIDGASGLETFGDAEAANPRSTQYFEVNGSRAIYHDGWKATTDYVSRLYRAERALIDGSHDFAADHWALFRLEDDFAEARDVADEHPDRARQLSELWWHEAGRNQVSPPMDGAKGMERGLPEPREYVWLPGGAPITTPPLGGGFTSWLSRGRSPLAAITASRSATTTGHLSISTVTSTGSSSPRRSHLV